MATIDSLSAQMLLVIETIQKFTTPGDETTARISDIEGMRAALTAMQVKVNEQAARAHGGTFGGAADADRG